MNQATGCVGDEVVFWVQFQNAEKLTPGAVGFPGVLGPGQELCDVGVCEEVPGLRGSLVAGEGLCGALFSSLSVLLKLPYTNECVGKPRSAARL